jgi:hypothetical protein
LGDTQKAKVFWGRRSPLPAAADFIHSLLSKAIRTRPS